MMLLKMKARVKPAFATPRFGCSHIYIYMYIPYYVYVYYIYISTEKAQPPQNNPMWKRASDHEHLEHPEHQDGDAEGT